MRRRMAMLVAVTAVSGVMMVFSPTANPAQATIHGACLGVLGEATVHSPLTYPVNTDGTMRAPHSASFHFAFEPGACVVFHEPSLPGVPSSISVTTTVSASGTVHGYCGLSTGSGTTNTGDTFHWVGVGGTLVITGDLSGAVNAVPDPLITGNSCTTGASTFLVSGTAVDHSCTTTTPVPVSVNGVSVNGVHDNIHACV